MATLPGPNNEPVEVPLTLKQDGATITGSFVRSEGRSLKFATDV
jgi:hypothetical protein